MAAIEHQALLDAALVYIRSAKPEISAWWNSQSQRFHPSALLVSLVAIRRCRLACLQCAETSRALHPMSPMREGLFERVDLKKQQQFRDFLAIGDGNRRDLKAGLTWRQHPMAIPLKDLGTRIIATYAEEMNTRDGWCAYTAGLVWYGGSRDRGRL